MTSKARSARGAHWAERTQVPANDIEAGVAGRPFWPAYVWAASLLAIFGGFLAGGLVFLARALGSSGPEWQAAAAQAHGRVQLFGWGGLMVLGVGLHFIPRLLSVRLEHGRRPWWILALMTTGLVLRLLAQPVLSPGVPHSLRLVAAVVLALSTTLLLIAAALNLLLVTDLFSTSGIRSRRAPQLSVRLLILTAFGSLVAALAVDWVGTVWAAWRLRPLVSAGYDNTTVLLGLSGFLVAISLAMSTRLFPLYIQTRLPYERWMRLSAAALIAALILRASGTASGDRTLAGAGQALEAAAVVCAVIGLRIFEPRRRLPRRRVRIVTDALQLHLLTAYLWLLAAAVLAGFKAATELGLSAPSPSTDVERHALGAGFVTILILGVGSEMLPGLSQSRLRRPRLRWSTLLLANGAAFARVMPLLNSAFRGQGADVVLSLAGLLGALAIAVFLVNFRLPPLRKSPSTTANRDPA